MNSVRRLPLALRRLLEDLETSEKKVVFSLAYAPPSVSVDVLSSLSGASAVSVLNVMETLKRKGVVSEKRETGRGIYCLRDASFVSFLRECISGDEARELGRKVMDYYSHLDLKGNEIILVLADLYEKLGNAGEGLKFVEEAADILAHSGQRAKAAAHYSHVLKHFSHGTLAPEHTELFLDSAIGQIHTMMHRMPVKEQITLLTKAQEIARKHQMWNRLARIDLRLGKALQDAGKHRDAAACIKEFLDLSKKIGNKEMIKATSHSLSEYYAYAGRFSEATRCYEETLGVVEKLADDEDTLMASQLVGIGHVLCGRISRGLGMIDAVRIKAQVLGFPQVVNYCDHASAICLLEIRRVAEAESYVNRLSSVPDDALTPLIAWGLCDEKAFILCSKHDYEGAFELVKKGIEHSKLSGRIYNPFPWNFETLHVLRSKGFSCEEMNLEVLIAKILNWDDIHMKGVAYRYRALLNADNQQMSKKVLSDLLESEKHLKGSGGEIELARTRIALGRYYLTKGQTETAHIYLSKARGFFSTIDSSLFPVDLLDMMPQENKLELMIERATRINEALGTIRDMASFLDRVINAAMDFTMALRGAFVMDDSGELKIVASRNLDPALFRTNKFIRVREFMGDTMNRGSELILPQSDSPDASPDADLGAVICMPAKLGDEILGYLCLEGRIGNEPFPTNQIPFLRMLCSQTAVGLSNIRIYEEVRERSNRLEDQADFYKKEMGIVDPALMTMGKSDGMKKVIGQIQQVAATNSIVLITGETGVGKELVAKVIHSLSDRKNGSFIPVNLAALPQELVASELFGHEKGAFTGAHDRQKGRFELAHGGTIFLDEIGDLPHAIQVKLLRVLQEGVFERLGSAQAIHSDFRVIVATNKDLSVEVEKGTFRQDLYYRLNVFPISVPPLRDRKEDIPDLARHFAEKFSKSMGKEVPRIPREELRNLTVYEWPGNVRELEHFVERAIILMDRHISFSGLTSSARGTKSSAGQKGKTLRDAERELIEETLQTTHWRISGPNGAAKVLGINESTLRFRMKKLGILSERPAN